MEENVLWSGEAKFFWENQWWLHPYAHKILVNFISDDYKCYLNMVTGRFLNGTEEVPVNTPCSTWATGCCTAWPEIRHLLTTLITHLQIDLLGPNGVQNWCGEWVLAGWYHFGVRRKKHSWLGVDFGSMWWCHLDLVYIRELWATDDHCVKGHTVINLPWCLNCT